MTVGRVLHGLVSNPRRHIFDRWNWKCALLSAALRGAVFFGTNLTFGVDAAFRALVVDAAFRLPLVGLYGAVTQAFIAAEPAWAAFLVSMVVVPVLAHSIEFLVHWSAGTMALGTSISASIGVSVLSSGSTLFAMRHGLLLVSAGLDKSVSAPNLVLRRKMSGVGTFADDLDDKALMR